MDRKDDDRVDEMLIYADMIFTILHIIYTAISVVGLLNYCLPICKLIIK